MRRAKSGYVVVAFALIFCIFSCAPARRPTHDTAGRDPGKAHKLTVEALEVLDKDPVKASELLLAALEADPYNGPAHNDMGVLYLRQSRLYDAATEFESARKLMPGNPDPRLNLGLTLEKGQLFDRALDAYNAALEVSPGDIRAIQAIARLTLRTGRKDDRLTDMLEDVSLRGKTMDWRNWAQEQMNRLKR